MLTLQQRVESLAKLGEQLQLHVNEFVHYNQNSCTEDNPFIKAIESAVAANGWFTKQNVIHAFKAIIPWLNKDSLHQWVSQYQLPEQNYNPKTIGVVMAGNIPMVNFHDMLSVLITGNRFLGKLSSSDSHLLPFIAQQLIKIQPAWKPFIKFTDGRLINPDAVIATGSNNTSRYFDYYFSRYPHIIRRNRTSVAVLHGHETDIQLQALGDDIFIYYGLGCRNVSKLFLPQGFSIERLIKQFEPHAAVIDHHKYHNNYDYHKAILLINKQPFFDAGFVLLKEDEALHAPVSMIHLSFYTRLQQVQTSILQHAEHIQCVVSSLPMPPIKTLQPGQTQQPSLTDYPDGVDVIKFLIEL